MAITHHYFGHAGEDAALQATATKTAAFSASFGDLVPVDSSGGAVTITLPPSNMIGEVGVRLAVGGNTVTVEGYLAETIDGAANTTLAVAGEVRVFASDGLGHWTTVSGGPNLTGISVTPVAVNVVAAAGAAETIPEPSAYGLNRIVLDENVTLTLPAATLGKTLRIVFVQDGTGTNTVTWPAGTIFADGALVISAGANTIDYVEAISVVEDVWMVYRPGKLFA